jgi:hypothetical protein
LDAAVAHHAPLYGSGDLTIEGMFYQIREDALRGDRYIPVSDTVGLAAF